MIGSRRRGELHKPLHIRWDRGWVGENLQIPFELTSASISHFLRRLGMPPTIRSNFCSCSVEIVLTNSIIVWCGNSTAQDRKTLQRVLTPAQLISGVTCPSHQDIHHTRVMGRAHNTIRDGTHPQHSLLTCYSRVKSRKTKQFTTGHQAHEYTLPLTTSMTVEL